MVFSRSRFKLPITAFSAWLVRVILGVRLDSLNLTETTTIILSLAAVYSLIAHLFPMFTMIAFPFEVLKKFDLKSFST